MTPRTSATPRRSTRNIPTATRRDVVGIAQTGTGKTAAFGLPLLAIVDADERDVQALVLAPTRELAMQSAQAIEDFAAVEQATGDELKALRDSMGDPSVYTSPTPPSASPAGGSAPSTDPATTAGTNGAPTQEAQTEF